MLLFYITWYTLSCYFQFDLTCDCLLSSPRSHYSKPVNWFPTSNQFWERITGCRIFMIDLLTVHYAFAALLHRGDTTRATLTVEFDRYLCSVAALECDLLVGKHHSCRSPISLVPSYVIAAHTSPPPIVWAGECKHPRWLDIRRGTN